MSIALLSALPSGFATSYRAFLASVGIDAVGLARVGESLTYRSLDGIALQSVPNLAYLARNASCRSHFDGLGVGDRPKTIVSCAVALDEMPDCAIAGGFARYCVCGDYHKVLRERLARLCDFLSDSIQLGAWRICIDTAPILEREWAVRAGMGHIGFNRMVIHPTLGSHIMLGEVLVEADLMPYRDILACETKPIVRTQMNDRTESIENVESIAPSESIVKSESSLEIELIAPSESIVKSESNKKRELIEDVESTEKVESSLEIELIAPRESIVKSESTEKVESSLEIELIVPSELIEKVESNKKRELIEDVESNEAIESIAPRESMAKIESNERIELIEKVESIEERESIVRIGGEQNSEFEDNIEEYLRYCTPGCMRCCKRGWRRCVASCPTGALSESGYDVSRCLSYWSTQHRGLVPEEMARAMGARLWGCDSCQTNCPWVRRAAPRPVGTTPLSELTLGDILTSSGKQLQKHLAQSPLGDAHPSMVVRNACIVVANTGNDAYRGELERLAQNHATDWVRHTALWALDFV